MKTLNDSKWVKLGTFSRTAIALALIATQEFNQAHAEGGYNGPTFQSQSIPLDLGREILDQDVYHAVNKCLIWGDPGKKSLFHRIFHDLYNATATCYVSTQGNSSYYLCPHTCTAYDGIMRSSPSYQCDGTRLHAFIGQTANMSPNTGYFDAGGLAEFQYFLSDAYTNFIFHRGGHHFSWDVNALHEIHEGEQPSETATATPSNEVSHSRSAALSLFLVDPGSNTEVLLHTDNSFPSVQFRPSREPGHFTNLGTPTDYKIIARNLKIVMPIGTDGQPIERLRFINAAGNHTPLSINVIEYKECVTADIQHSLNLRGAH